MYITRKKSVEGLLCRDSVGASMDNLIKIKNLLLYQVCFVRTFELTKNE